MRIGPNWLLIPILGAGISLATGSSLAGPLIAYVIAGWHCVRTGIWLCTSDDRKSRGNILLCFYVAAAGWRAGVAALLTLLALGLVEELAGARPNMDTVSAVLVGLLFALVITTLVGALAVLLAVRWKVRAFVVPDLYEMCEGDFGSIAFRGPVWRRFNQAIFVVATSCAAVVIAMTLAALVAIAAIAPQLNANVQSVIGVALLVLPIVVVVPIYAFISNRVIARNPLECWPVID